MKNSMTIKAAALILAASMTLALASCGDNESSSKEEKAATTTAAADIVTEESSEAQPAEITGETKTWGVFTVLVPNGWTLKGGDFLDENDPDVVSVKESDFKYFDIKSETEEVQKKQYEYNKNTYTNEQQDLPATTFGGIEWNGFSYGNDFGGGFELYAKSGDKYLRVSSAGFAFDGPETKAVLDSLLVSTENDGGTEAGAETSAAQEQE